MRQGNDGGAVQLLRQLNAGNATGWRSDPSRDGVRSPWPSWVDEAMRAGLKETGVETPWKHQRDGWDALWDGRHVMVATATASGKSLVYGLPIVAAAQGIVPPWFSAHASLRRDATAIYLAPTKALAHDQARNLTQLWEKVAPDHPVRVGVVDGDAGRDQRDWARSQATVLVSNPDWVHHALLPHHRQWGHFLRQTAYVVVDEAHVYRGVFGTSASYVLRRLSRVLRHHGAQPRWVIASASCGNPGEHAEALTGLPFTAITNDTSASPARNYALWRTSVNPLTDTPISAYAETERILGDFVAAGVRTLAFVNSRRGAETLALGASRRLAEMGVGREVVAYRGGYLPQERRAIERGLRDGSLWAVATTSALELGVDISGLDASVVVGWPGTAAALWQRWGRAGRGSKSATAVFVGRNDPLDTYIIEHPDAVLNGVREHIVINPRNVHIAAPQLLAAAADVPLGDHEPELRAGLSDPLYEATVQHLMGQNLLRTRPNGVYFAGHGHPSHSIGLRGEATTVNLIEHDTGAVLGTVGRSNAPAQVHKGAVYVHQGARYVVEALHLDDNVALLQRSNAHYDTRAKSTTSVTLLDTAHREHWGEVALCTGGVQVTNHVTGFEQFDPRTNEILGRIELDLPPSDLRTSGVWWEIPYELVLDLGLDETTTPGALHAAEHTLIGMLPLFATCDRWDVGGVSTAEFEQTDSSLIVVYDALPGGAGVAAAGFEQAADWWRTTARRISDCGCDTGCPRCIQSPKCGNGNEPLFKYGALKLMDHITDQSGFTRKAEAPQARA